MACTGRPHREVVWPKRLARGARTDHIQDTVNQFCTDGVMPSFTQLLPAPDCPNIKLFGVRNIRAQCPEYPGPMSGMFWPNVRNVLAQCPEYPCPMSGISVPNVRTIRAQCPEYPGAMSGISGCHVRNIRVLCPDYPGAMFGIFAGNVLSVCAQCLVKGSARTTSQTGSINLALSV